MQIPKFSARNLQLQFRCCSVLSSSRLMVEDASSCSGVGWLLLLSSGAILTTPRIDTFTSLTRTMSEPRKQYPATFKRKVILVAETIRNCAAGRHFSVSEGSIRGWRKQKEAIFSYSGLRRSFRGLKNGVFPEIEQALTAFRAMPTGCSLGCEH